LGLDVLGAGLIIAGYIKDGDAQRELDRYNVSGQYPEYYKDAKKNAESNASVRNVFYVAGGLVLASGIGVHIWF